MKKQIQTVFWLVVFETGLFSQNLVVNGDFEQSDFCQSGFTNLPGWFQLRSADLWTTTCVFNLQPHSGKAAVGLYAAGVSQGPNSTFESREYVFGRLTKPLVAGKNYDVHFFAKPFAVASTIQENHVTSNISVSFLMDTSEIKPLVVANSSAILLPEHIVNQNGIIRDPENFVKIDGCFTAKGGETWIALGNFRTEATTTLAPFGANSIYDYAYLLIDDVWVGEVEPPVLPPDTAICRGEELVLTFDTSRFSPILVQGNQVFDKISIKSGAEYLIEMTQGACRTEQSIALTDEVCENCQFFVPNAFSPNGDGENDELGFHSDCQSQILNAKIFDRWGQLLFESGENFNWNGLFRGKGMPPAVYFYWVEIELDLLKGTQKKQVYGNFTLIR